MNAEIDVTDVRIVTDRLILRPWTMADLNDFYEYARVEDVGQMAGWLPHKSIEESRQILSSFIEQKKTFALELRESGKVIGSLGVEELRPDPVGEGRFGRELGYVLNKDYWGRGLMPEAVRAVISYCFSELGMDYLTCGHFLRNQRSRRVIEKAGFQYLRDGLYQTRYGTQEREALYILHNPAKISAPFDASATRLETPRLLLRPLTPEDWKALYPTLTDREIADLTGWKPVATEQEAQAHVQRHVEENETLALVLKENGQMIGTLSVQKRPWGEYPINQALRGRELGFDLSRDYWGRGLMPEAVRAVCEHCFETLGYDFVTCGAFRRNERSMHTIEKCGFAFLDEAERQLPTGVTEDILTYIRYSPKNPTGEFHYV